MIFNIVGLVIGLLIFGAGVYYLVKEKKDKESHKIYGATIGVGLVIILFVMVKMLIEILF